MTRTSQFVLLAAVFLATSSISAGQAASGVPPFSSTMNGGIDTINIGNLNVSISIPVLDKAGLIPFHYAIANDSSVWYPTLVNGVNTWQYIPNFGWHSDTEASTGYVTYSSGMTKCYDQPPGWYWGYTYGAYVYHDAWGALHPFSLSFKTCVTSPPPTPVTATDGSGYTLNSGGSYATIITKDGRTFNPPMQAPTGSAVEQDANGNKITATYSSSSQSTSFTDTLNTTALTIAGSGTASSPKTFTYTPPSGPGVALTLYYTTKAVKTYFQCNTSPNIVAEFGPTNIDLVSSIGLPDGTYYTLQYEQTPGAGNSGYTTGRIASIQLPTGGTISYAYTGSNDGINCADGTTLGLNRTTPDSATAWQYTRALVSGTNWKTTVLDPAGDQTVVNFQETAPNFYETERQIYSPTGTLLQTLLTCYNASASPCNGTAVGLPITQRAVTLQWPNGEQSKTVTDYDSTYQRVTEVDEYDYGAGGPGGLTRKTMTTYASLGSIVDHPATVQVESGSGTLFAQTNYGYNSYGNTTSISRLVSSNVWLTQSFTYNSNGTVATATDANTAVTSYTYGAGSCNGAFPTSISEPMNLSVSIAWDSNCNGGVPVSFTDENLQQTVYSYNDTLGHTWRLTGITFPDGGQTTYTYNPPTQTSPANTVSVSKINLSQSQTSTTILDWMGRISQQQLNSAPGGTIYTDTSYDALGRTYTVSNPYQSTGDPTYGVTTYSYDALGRVTTITRPDHSTAVTTYNGRAAETADEGNGTNPVQRVSQWDGLGRLVEVCEVTNTTQSGITPTPSACGLDIAPSPNGFLTTYQYDVLNDLIQVSQGGLNTRSYSYDGLSRMTSENNPESGTTSYAYNTNGDLYQRTQPAPNQTNPGVTVVTTYSHDALHRLTGKSYSDGATPGATYVYDASSYWGYTLPNSKGRLVAAITTTAVTGGVSIGSLFGYDQVGRVDLVYQRTPIDNGSGAFSIAYTYDYLGDVTSASNGEGVTLNYSYDSAANLSGTTSTLSDANHPGTLLSGVGYNPLGAMTSATLGNGIVQSRAYNNRGFLQSLSDGTVYTVANSIGHAPNGDILSANDSINGNWTFSYDDFNRISAAAKAGDSYTFSYDRFGNRWAQSGGVRQSSLSFDANNHIAAGNGVTYDAAGNVTNDGFHSYTYDAESRIISVDSTYTYVYDAGGQRMRQATPSGTYDYLYDLQARVVTAINSANQWARGEIYAGPAHVGSYANGSTYFEHSDWLGTVRARTDPTGAPVETCTTEWFGDGQVCTGSDPSPLHYAGHELDSESNLNHFLYRQYSSAQGRWITPDPAGMSAADPSMPQSWNRYAYVANNPVAAVDPAGLDWCDIDCGFDGGPWDGGSGWGDGDAQILAVILHIALENWAGVPSVPLNGETLGIPNNIKLPKPNPTLVGIFLPGNMQCDFGVCVPYPSAGEGWATGITGAGTADSPYTMYVFVLVRFLAAQAGNTASAAAPTKAKCLGQALSKNAVSLVTDGLGFIPGESLGITLLQLGVGITGTVNSAIHEDTAGALGGIAGIHVAAFAPFAKEAGWGIAKSVPVFGMVINGGFTLRDLGLTTKDYLACMRGQ